MGPEFDRAKRYPVVIHYLGDERPWIAGNHNHYRKLYETYLDRTPWKDAQAGRKGALHAALVVLQQGHVHLSGLPPVDQPTVRHEGDRLQKESAGLNHMDKISCIVLNYNDASTACGLAEELLGISCLDSVVVVDNCSTDDSWERLTAFAAGRSACPCCGRTKRRLRVGKPAGDRLGGGPSGGGLCDRGQPGHPRDRGVHPGVKAALDQTQDCAMASAQVKKALRGAAIQLLDAAAALEGSA